MPTELDPSPVFHSGGETAVILIHGFTGAPCEMSRLAAYLHERGLTVEAPLLPGHGTEPADLNRKTWQDWFGHIEARYLDLEARYDSVFVAGLSLGSLLALYLASRYPAMSGVIAYAPAVKITDWRAPLAAVIKYFLSFMPKSKETHFDPGVEEALWCYDVYPIAASHEVLKLQRLVQRALPRTTCPALIVSSVGDTTIHPDAAQFTLDGLGSTDKELVTVERSGHVITLDAEWETVAAATLHFVRAHEPERT